MADASFNFEFDLDKMMSRHSMRNYINGPNFEQALILGLKKGHEEVADKLIDKLFQNLESFGLDKGTIINSLDIDIMDEGISLIINDGDEGYAMFVEFGTGVVGKDNQHPKPNMSNWTYDINEHGESGWWYPSKESDPNPTKYLSKSGEWWAWTKGQASRPFMYLTWRWATSSATQIIDKHIKREFRRLEREFK